MQPDGTRPARSRMAELEERIAGYRADVGPLVGRTCSRVTIDQSDPPLVLGFLGDGSPAARVEVNGPFRFGMGTDGWLLDPWDDRSALAPLLSLIGRTVTTAIADESGSLRLEFSGDVSMEIDGSDTFEPWWFDIDDAFEVESDVP